MAVATAKALEAGARTLLCASTGNTSASAAAYAARCGLRAVVVVPAGGVAAGKLAQALAYGATILTVTGSFDIALRLVRQLAGEPGVALVNSVNPFRIEGQKTGAFEIVEQLGAVPARLHGSIVCVLTGHGLKDPQALTRGLRLPRPVRPTLSTLLRAIG